MIVQCSYHQWKNFFEALDRETARRTPAKKNAHVSKNSTSLCLSSNVAAFLLFERNPGSLLSFTGLVSKPGLHVLIL